MSRALSVMATVSWAALVVCCASRASESTAVASPSASTPAVIMWGQPTDGDENAVTPIGPTWCVSARKQGGSWSPSIAGTTIPAWTVSRSDTGSPALVMGVAQSLLNADLRLDIAIMSAAGATVRVDLLDALGTPETVGRFTLDAAPASIASIELPTASRRGVTAIRVQRESGEMSIYSTVLTPVSQVASLNTISSPRIISAATIAASGRAHLQATDAAQSERSPESIDAAATSVPREVLEYLVAFAEVTVSNVVPATHLDAAIVYVDPTTGSDCFQGRRPSPATTAVRVDGISTIGLAADGPKATIGAGLASAGPGDLVIIRGGNYGEPLNLAGRPGRVKVEGTVNLAGQRRRPATDSGSLRASSSNTNALSGSLRSELDASPVTRLDPRQWLALQMVEATNAVVSWRENRQ